MTRPEPEPTTRRGAGSIGPGAAERRSEPRLQAQDRLRVELRDARLRHAEYFADLPERELLVVVERDDELLALRQREMASPSASRSSVCAIAICGSAACGSSIVSMSATASPLEPGLAQSSSSAAIEEREISMSES